MKIKESRLGNPVNIVGVRKCLSCESLINKKGNKYCSHKCYWKAKKGTKQTLKHRNNISRALIGKPKSPEHNINAKKAWLASLKKGNFSLPEGAKHWGWKGDQATYGSLHDWVAGKLGRPKKCEHCYKKGSKYKYQWANISGKYKRDLNDWIRLCVQCHRKMDKNIPRATLIYRYDKKNKMIREKLV